MRLASSGPLHNLITYGWLFFLAFSGTGSFLWKDQGDVGRVVQAVSSVCISIRTIGDASTDTQTSPLYRHISPGRVITYLDEVSLGGDADKWSQYLQDKISDDDTRGWCIDQSTFAGT
jgi:S2P endopeptidase